MPTEAIYDQLAKASSADEIKSILDGQKAKIVYASEAPGAKPAGDSLPGNAAGGVNELMGDEPESDAEAATPGEEGKEKDDSLSNLKAKAVKKAFGGKGGF